MNTKQNYFELFGLAIDVDMDLTALASRYRKLQQDIHPDRYASKGAAEQRVAVQFAAYVNTAYQTLKNPLLRAEYLLALVGQPVDRESLKINDTHFLMAQMEWRERLSELSDAVKERADQEATENALEAALSQAKSGSQQLQKAFADHYQEQCYVEAKEVIAKWHFANKLLMELQTLAERLDD